MKTCNKCQIKKEFNDFNKNVQASDGRHNKCKKCKNIELKIRYHTDIEYKNKRLKNQKKYQESKHGKKKIQGWEQSENGAECRIKYKKSENGKLVMNRYNKKRLSNIQYRLHNNISRSIRYGISNKNGKPTFDILPYTVKQLMDHLESQFKPGMSWENCGRDGWNIDHIIPQSDFAFSSYNDEEFQKCWALENLQPLWEPDNTSKGNKNWNDWLNLHPDRKEYYGSAT